MAGGLQIGSSGIVIGTDGIVVTDSDSTPCCCTTTCSGCADGLAGGVMRVSVSGPAGTCCSQANGTYDLAYTGTSSGGGFTFYTWVLTATDTGGFCAGFGTPTIAWQVQIFYNSPTNCGWSFTWAVTGSNFYSTAGAPSGPLLTDLCTGSQTETIYAVGTPIHCSPFPNGSVTVTHIP